MYLSFTKKSIISSLFVGILSLSVCAEDDKSEKKPGSGPNPYTDCGIGASLFPDTPWAAVTSNVTWDAGTTALTSATASPETCNGKDVEVAEFIYRSYDSLVEDTARGEGEYLTSLLNIMQVQESFRGEVVDSIRSKMLSNIIQDTYMAMDDVEKSTQYYNIVLPHIS